MSSIAFILGFCLIVTGILMLSTSWGSKAEITDASPGYASRLFQPLSSQFFLGKWPVRSRVLFFEAPPAKILPTVRLLRSIYVAHWLLFLAFVGCVLAVLLG
jgi:hypothetical protein